MSHNKRVWIVVGAIVVVLLAYLMLFNHPLPTQAKASPEASTPAKIRPSLKPAPEPASGAMPAAAASAPTSSPRTTAAPASSARALVVVLPGLPPPPNMTSGRAAYAVEGAQEIAYGSYQPWVSIGSTDIDVSATNFTSLPVAGLAADLPSEGRARETWTFWTRVKTDGAQVFAMRLDSPEPATAELHVDGQGRPVVSANSLGVGTPTSIGQIDMGAGWHTLTLTLTHSSKNQTPAEVAISAFMRGPSDSAPASFMPSAPTTAGAGVAAAKALAAKPSVPAATSHPLSSRRFSPPAASVSAAAKKGARA